MPIHEASRHTGRAGELTERQKLEAQAAVYGLPPPIPMQPDLTADDIARMRQILAQHDAQAQPVREFDLNHPPRAETLAPGTPGANGPYIWQPFPQMLYDHENRRFKTVQNEVEKNRMLEAGWRVDPYPAEPVANEPELDAATKAEVERIDAEARKKPPAKK
jgi:hypothetical protein